MVLNEEKKKRKSKEGKHHHVKKHRKNDTAKYLMNHSILPSDMSSISQVDESNAHQIKKYIPAQQF